MSGTGASISKKSSGGLSIPKVKLMSGDATDNGKPIEWYKYGSNSSGGVFKLLKFPMVIAMDLTDEQIKQGVYIEMAYYRNSKAPSTRVSEMGAGYVIPADNVGETNRLGNGWVRGGLQQFRVSGNFKPKRPNHYKVTVKNEVIPVWEYLHNRMSFYPVGYSDTLGNYNTIDILVPSHRIRSVTNQAGTHFGYSGILAPYYFMFRYIMKGKKRGDYISGGWSRVVKMMYKQFPFNYDDATSSSLGVACNTISPLFDSKLLKCEFETKLP